MILDTATRSLEVVLGEPMSVRECDITAFYATTSAAVFVPAAATATSSGTTPVTVVSPPATGVVAQVNEVRVHNRDTIDHNVYLRLNDAGTISIVHSGTAKAGGNWVYAPGAGVTGAPGPQGDTGPPGPGVETYIFAQALPSALWTITHNLGRYPSVTVADSSNRLVEGDVAYVSADEITVAFVAAFSGQAYLN